MRFLSFFIGSLLLALPVVAQQNPVQPTLPPPMDSVAPLPGSVVPPPGGSVPPVTSLPQLTMPKTPKAGPSDGLVQGIASEQNRRTQMRQHGLRLIEQGLQILQQNQ